MTQGIEGGRPLGDGGPFLLVPGAIICRSFNPDRVGVAASKAAC